MKIIKVKQKDEFKVFAYKRVQNPYSVDGKRVDVWLADPETGIVIKVDDDLYEIPFDALVNKFLKEILKTDIEFRFGAPSFNPKKYLDRSQPWKWGPQEKLKEARKWKSKHSGGKQNG